MPDHILTVYRPGDPGREFIAKKLRRKSDELKILTLLKNTETKSIHVVRLIQSFGGWAILPKMVPLEDAEWPFACESEVVKVCKGLIAGVRYLHSNRIAHRDIKPNNLVVDREFCLKIIDFDLAMQVKDENEEVDDQWGTNGWMAPEVENELRHSPIRADRWACGQVIQYLLGKVETVDKEFSRLEEIARKLYANNPKERPSLLDHEWSSLVPVR